MLCCFDVHYREHYAVAVGGLFQSWDDTQFSRIYHHRCDDVQPYEPGAFYQRELPCLLALLADIVEPLTTIIIDGYVTLGPAEKKGLGAHLYEDLQQRIPIVGVAKTRFINTPTECFLLRGESTSPLYVTSAGVPLEKAKACIAAMSGEYRLPTLLKEIDRLSKTML